MGKPKARVKPIRIWAIQSPLFGPRLLTFGMSAHPSIVRRNAVKIGTTYGGAAQGETWAALYKQGYRVAPVLVTPIERKRK